MPELSRFLTYDSRNDYGKRTDEESVRQPTFHMMPQIVSTVVCLPESCVSYNAKTSKNFADGIDS